MTGGLGVAIRARTIALLCSVGLGLASPALAQESPAAPPQTRADMIATERADKLAELWPERQNAMVDLVNGFVERGFKEGLDSGRGGNGFQGTVGGMRAGQGLSLGVGYRRSDLLHEQLDYRSTARVSGKGGYMFDADLDFKSLRTERTSLRWYSKYEHSPSIEYFGEGNTSSKDDRTSYRFDDFSSDFLASFQLVRNLHLGATAGYYWVHTAPSGQEDLPPINEAFSSTSLPGFGQDTEYGRVGALVYYDSRDSRTGPRDGGVYGARYREYWDVRLQSFAFRQAEFEAQRYLPYFNRGRVIAIRAAAVLSFPKGNGTVPLYLQPTLGGSDDLRGFTNYRFRDYHSLSIGLEHRWHAFSLLDMSTFVDAGKVVPLKSELTPTHLHVSGGLGFRVRVRSAVVSRTDFAVSREGFRIVWTFSDIFGLKAF